MTLDLFHELAYAEILCLFHNCMWISRHSEVNVYFSSSCVNEPVLRLRFRLRLCLYLHVQQTLAHNSGWMVVHSQVSPFLSLCFRSQTSLVSKPGGCSFTGPPVLDNWGLDFGWICWESLLPPATSESNSFIQLSLQEIFGGGRGDTYTFWYIISPVSIIIAFGMQWAGSVS